MPLNAKIKEEWIKWHEKRTCFILVAAEGQMSRSINPRIVSESINNMFVEIAHAREFNINFRSFISSEGYFVKLCFKLTS